VTVTVTIGSEKQIYFGSSRHGSNMNILSFSSCY